jgi:hypothetical protein
VTDPHAPRLRSTVMLAVALAGGCGVTRLQTARTIPAGETRTTVGASLVTNDLQHRVGFSAFPVDVMVRHGVTPQTDFGVRLFFGLGALADVKWNLLRPDRKTALAISGGFGAAADPTTAEGTANDLSGGIAAILHVPVTVTVSREVTSWLAVYGAAGYGTYWILGYGYRDPALMYADRTLTGDGVLDLHAGVELTTSTGRAVLFEYSHLRPVVNDPGDLYSFTSNNLFSIAFRTGHGTGNYLSR